MFVLDLRGRLRVYDAAGARTHQFDIAEADVSSQRLPLGVACSGKHLASRPSDSQMLAVALYHL